MKVYFEDGKLTKPNSIDFKYSYIVDAGNGFTQNDVMFDFIQFSDNNASVYTNSLVALDNRLVWNEELEVPELYLWRNDKFVRIDKLTNRQLKRGHNLERMYIAGEFE
jgi:hypothetical protein